MDIYRKKEDIELSPSILEKVRTERYETNTIDKSLVSADNVKEIDIENIKELPNGRLSIIINGVRFECMFKKGKNKKLWVFPSAARTRDKGLAPVPLLQRWSYYSVLEDSVLCVSDPMYYDFPNLGCGWFWGTKELNYRELLAHIVRKIVDFCDIEDDNVVFMGSSSGGTTAIHAASLFGGGTAISINGQLNFETEKFTKRIEHFERVTHFNLHEQDLFHRNELHNVVLNNSSVKYIIVTNISSNGDMQDHLSYFTDKINFKPTYGLSSKDNIIFWLYEANSNNPHTAFEDKQILFALDYLTKIKPDEVDEYKGLYRLFGNFWYETFEKKNTKMDNYELMPSVFQATSFLSEKAYKNVSVEKANSEYNRFSHKGLKSNRIYVIRFKAEVNNDDSQYSFGIYDGKKFILKYTFDSKVENTIAFCCNNAEQLEVCLYAGVYGKTKGKEVSIKYLDIYSADMISEDILKFYKVNNENLKARFDVKLDKSDSTAVGNNDLNLFKADKFMWNISKPAWLNNPYRTGYVIDVDEGYAKFKVTTNSAGTFQIDFKGIDKKIDEKRIPIWVDYTSIKINEEEIIHTITPCWHDKGITYRKSVDRHEEIIVEVHWKQHTL